MGGWVGEGKEREKDGGKGEREGGREGEVGGERGRNLLYFPLLSSPTQLLP